MKTAALAALLVAGAAARPLHHQLDGYTFEQYTKDFSKTYTAEEAPARRAAFESTLAEVREHNANPTALYKKGINHLSDWSAEELKSLRGLKRTPQTHNLAGAKKWTPSADVSVPKSLDYRTAVPPVLTAVKDQGQCGSCWAHGSTETLESHYAIQTGNLFVMSQQQVTSCAPNPNKCGGTGGCQGSTAELAYEYVIKAGGITEDWQYGYSSFFGDTGSCSVPSGAKNVASFKSYVTVPSNDRNSVMEAVAQAGPLAVNVDASKWSFYDSGIFNGCDYGSNIDIDHVVQLVGYGHDDGLKADYWLVRNSWSASYGESGYIRLLRENTTVCGTDSTPADGTGCNNGPASVKVCGMCGVLYDTSYPIPVVASKESVKLH